MAINPLVQRLMQESDQTQASPLGVSAQSPFNATDISQSVLSQMAGQYGGSGASTSGGDGGSGSGSMPTGAVQQLAAQLAGERGWGDQWNSLNNLVTRESSWNPNAQNPTSTAYGLFQFLNSTWDNYGHTKTSDPRGQILAGLDYIARRYGDPNGAWKFWQQNHWY